MEAPGFIWGSEAFKPRVKEAKSEIAALAAAGGSPRILSEGSHPKSCKIRCGGAPGMERAMIFALNGSNPLTACLTLGVHCRTPPLLPP